MSFCGGTGGAVCVSAKLVVLSPSEQGKPFISYASCLYMSVAARLNTSCFCHSIVGLGRASVSDRCRDGGARGADPHGAGKGVDPAGPQGGEAQVPQPAGGEPCEGTYGGDHGRLQRRGACVRIDGWMDG